MKRSNVMLSTTLLVAWTVGTVAVAVAQQPASSHPPHLLITPAELKWVAAPPSLPPGAKAVLLEGDMARPELFTLRLQLPANYRIPAHWHPAAEHVTVLSGAFHVGTGDKLDDTQAKALAAGSFMLMPAKTNHFAFTRTPTEIQLHGMGPWGITYVNPADDPRRK